MFIKLKNRARKFMQGRYGYFDALNKTLLFTSLFLLLVANFITVLAWPMRFLAYAIFILTYARIFSKKIYVRSNENQKFLLWRNRWLKKGQQTKSKFEQRKTYTFFHCPECKQALRAPKGRGQIKITCSKCQHVFFKKV